MRSRLSRMRPRNRRYPIDLRSRFLSEGCGVLGTLRGRLSAMERATITCNRVQSQRTVLREQGLSGLRPAIGAVVGGRASVDSLHLGPTSEMRYLWPPQGRQGESSSCPRAAGQNTHCIGAAAGNEGGPGRRSCGPTSVLSANGHRPCERLMPESPRDACDGATTWKT